MTSDNLRQRRAATDNAAVPAVVDRRRFRPNWTRYGSEKGTHPRG
jgi:hypothetical protein